MQWMNEKDGQDVVLIVDDIPENLAMLSDALDESGYLVLVATNGASAIERLDHVTPDMILLDAIMPGIDGFETCRRIKTLHNVQHVPVVFMTGLTDTEHVLKGFQAGGIDYVTKPIQPLEVIARIRTHIRNARLLSQARGAIDAARDTGIATDRDNRPLWHVGRALDGRSLTPRESDVLAWLAKGKTNRDIGEILGVSPRTVNKHLEHIYVKLGVETRSAAAALAVGRFFSAAAIGQD